MILQDGVGWWRTKPVCGFQPMLYTTFDPRPEDQRLDWGRHSHSCVGLRWPLLAGGPMRDVHWGDGPCMHPGNRAKRRGRFFFFPFSWVARRMQDVRTSHHQMRASQAVGQCLSASASAHRFAIPDALCARPHLHLTESTRCTSAIRAVLPVGRSIDKLDRPAQHLPLSSTSVQPLRMSQVPPIFSFVPARLFTNIAVQPAQSGARRFISTSNCRSGFATRDGFRTMDGRRWQCVWCNVRWVECKPRHAASPSASAFAPRLAFVSNLAALFRIGKVESELFFWIFNSFPPRFDVHRSGPQSRSPPTAKSQVSRGPKVVARLELHG